MEVPGFPENIAGLQDGETVTRLPYRPQPADANTLRPGIATPRHPKALAGHGLWTRKRPPMPRSCRRRRRSVSSMFLVPQYRAKNNEGGAPRPLPCLDLPELRNHRVSNSNHGRRGKPCEISDKYGAIRIGEVRHDDHVPSEHSDMACGLKQLAEHDRMRCA